MKEVKLGVIGCGGMAQAHMRYFDKVKGLNFVAAADIDKKTIDYIAKEHDVKTFNNGDDLINSGLVDAILIATPHYFHPTFSIAAIKKGIHVLSEKPVAVTAKAAAEVNEVHKNYPDVIYAAMFNQRTVPLWKKVKQLITDGELGQIQRVNWIITNWYRSQTYYNSGGWRATWQGEGGGVLLNQCPHNLDLIQWFVGMPSRVTATIGIGKYHHIEVEDEVTAFLEYPNGATGVFITSTGEAPGTNRLEITGDRGKLIATPGKPLEFVKTDISVSEYTKITDKVFSTPPHCKMTIEPTSSEDSQHKNITINFINAILHGETLIAPAEEGINGLELGNAMMISGFSGKPTDVPTDRDTYDALIKKMADESTFKKGEIKKNKGDLDKSW